jgi:phosphopantothenoylcysteine decarboxylase/phosphopantothenate--cysteine ligase
MSAPRLPLGSRHISLGVTGSIAAFKAADLASKLRQLGADVEVVMTPAATRFVTPLTFQSLTGRPVVVDMFVTEEAEAHAEVSRRADALVIAPASADCLANLAHGQAPDMVSLTALATAAPIVVAPAMDSQMWENPATRANVALLEDRGVVFAGPREGRLASGRTGSGRMSEVPEILGVLRQALGARSGDLAGRHILVTAGGTQEPIDPVRYIGNRSTGKMGIAVAEAAIDRGARVTVVCGPTVSVPVPHGARCLPVGTTLELLAAMEHLAPTADAVVMAGAPADFRSAASATQKIKKQDNDDALRVHLVKNPDVIATLQGGGVRVGFAAETENLATNAVEKLARKRLDFIVANDVTREGSGFGADTNEVTVFHADGRVDEFPIMTKYEVGHAILDRIRDRLP